NNFSYKTVIDKNEYICDLPVKLSWTDEYVQLLAGESLTVLVPNEAEKNSIEIDLDFLDGKSKDAKIKQGELLAIANVYYANEKIGTIELVAAKDIKRSLMQYSWMLFTRSMGTVWFKLIFAVIGITLLLYWVIATVQINSINKKRRRVRRHR
ncbi:MAG: hypothetical protein UHZ05_07505, partial [Acutalibacteraceae bacterium]|nr:hypothetical protein [Acutalibacteraceae bacterium]